MKKYCGNAVEHVCLLLQDCGFPLLVSAAVQTIKAEYQVSTSYEGEKKKDISVSQKTYKNGSEKFATLGFFRIFSCIFLSDSFNVDLFGVST